MSDSNGWGPSIFEVVASLVAGAVGALATAAFTAGSAKEKINSHSEQLKDLAKEHEKDLNKIEAHALSLEATQKDLNRRVSDLEREIEKRIGDLRVLIAEKLRRS